MQTQWRRQSQKGEGRDTPLKRDRQKGGGDGGHRGGRLHENDLMRTLMVFGKAVRMKAMPLKRRGNTWSTAREVGSLPYPTFKSTYTLELAPLHLRGEQGWRREGGGTRGEQSPWRRGRRTEGGGEERTGRRPVGRATASRGGGIFHAWRIRGVASLSTGARTGGGASDISRRVEADHSG